MAQAKRLDGEAVVILPDGSIERLLRVDNLLASGEEQHVTYFMPEDKRLAYEKKMMERAGRIMSDYYAGHGGGPEPRQDEQ